MGFFDRFGVGGGSVTVQLATPQAAPGSMVQGTITYTGGSRPQNITALKIHVSVTQPAAKGSNAQTETQQIVPQQNVSNAFTAQPGQAMQFPFQFQLPMGIPGSMPPHTVYRLSVSADIDGEVDPGTSVELSVIGGAAQGYPQQGYPQQGYPQQGYPQGGADPYAQKMAAAQQGGFQKPQYEQPGYDPNIAAKKAGAYDYDQGNAKFDPNAKGGYPDQGGYADPNAKAGYDPYGKGGYVDPNAKAGYVDPNMKGGYVDPNAKAGYDPYAAQQGGGKVFPVGAKVQAQFPDGNYYGAKVSQSNGEYYLVEWDHGGQPGWVHVNQISG